MRFSPTSPFFGEHDGEWECQDTNRVQRCCERQYCPYLKAGPVKRRDTVRVGKINRCTVADEQLHALRKRHVRSIRKRCLALLVAGVWTGLYRPRRQ